MTTKNETKPTNEPKPVTTDVISTAMRILTRDIQSEDGVANQACWQAAERLDEQERTIEKLNQKIATLQFNLTAATTYLQEATTDMKDWAAYAPPYFQEKHDLKGDVEKYQSYIKELQKDCFI